MDADEWTETIEEKADLPQQVKVGLNEVHQRPLKDLIAADLHEAQKRAAGQKHGGMRITKLVPPGSV